MDFGDFGGNEGDARAYCALARVDDEDPIQVLSSVDPETGKKVVLGTSVDCTIVDGVFVGAKVAAKLCAPIGQATPNLPGPGDLLLLALTHGHLDGPVLATHVVPGGAAKPMPAAVAGIDVSDPDKLGKVQLVAPPKGVGVRHYVRSAPYVIRLKGTAELYIEIDDGGPDKNGTYIRLTQNPANGKFGIKLREASGAFVQVHDGAVSMQSPNGENGFYVSDDGIKLVCTCFQLKNDGTTDIGGASILIGMGTGEVPTPSKNSALVGTGVPNPGPGVPTAPAAPTNGYMSSRVFIGTSVL